MGLDDLFEDLRPPKVPRKWKEKTPTKEEIPEGTFVVITDAGYKNGIVGISTIIITRGKKYKPREYSGRAWGPNHAELLAVRKGLERLKSIRKSIRKIVVYTDSQLVYELLVGYCTPRKEHIKEEVGKIRILESYFGGNVNYLYIPGKHVKRVDRRAFRKRKAEEERKKEQIEERIEHVKRTITKSKEVKIVERDGEYYALPKYNGFPPGYRVSLEELSCECPHWKHRWGNKPKFAVRARALPCKHMCALAEHLGLNIFDIFKKQIERVD